MKARILPFNPTMRSSDGRLMGEGRGAGLHLGDVIKSLREFIDGPAKAYSNDNFAQFGFMFELWVGHAMAVYLKEEVHYIVPGEIEVDGVFMNPDGLGLDNNTLPDFRGAVLEFKCKWAWCLNEIEPQKGVLDLAAFQRHFWYMLIQLMSYCRAMGTRKGVLVILFVAGTKSDAWGPQMRIFPFEFRKEELEKNWQVVLQHAATLRRSRA